MAASIAEVTSLEPMNRRNRADRSALSLSIVPAPLHQSHTVRDQFSALKYTHSQGRIYAQAF